RLNLGEVANQEFRRAINHLSDSNVYMRDNFEQSYRYALANVGLALHSSMHLEISLELYKRAIDICSNKGVINYESLLVKALIETQNGKEIEPIYNFLKSYL